MSPALFMLVTAAGGLGAGCRYVVDYAVTQRTRSLLPWGTWAVNVSGSLALGFLVGMAVHLTLPSAMLPVVGGGFLGAYTTFSTWMYESLRLLEQRAWVAAALNLAGSLLSGIAAAGVGLALAAAAF